MTFDKESPRLFWYFMNERHRIYMKYKVYKEPWPWTEDVILQTYKFTNIFRELDTGTIWLRENWLEPFADHETLFFNICLYRQFNWIPTATFLRYQLKNTDVDTLDARDDVYFWDPSQVEQDLRARKNEDGQQIFTGAHMLTGTLGGKERKDKIWQVVWAVLDHLWNNEEKYAPQPGDTLQAAFERLKAAPGFGPFLAYEVVTDLYHTRYLKDAPDIMTWANPGPGAMRGINRLLGLPTGRIPATKRTKPSVFHYPVKQLPTEEYIEIMRHLLHVAQSELDSYIPREMLDMRAIEHSLCEFDKYMRAMQGQGRPRSTYTPPASFVRYETNS